MKQLKLGTLETAFFSWTQMRGIEQVRTGDLVTPLAFTPKQERELLSRMARNGLIVRLMRGLYLVPRKIPPGGKWMPNDQIILFHLMKDLNATYQLTGLNAFNTYGLSEQVPNNVYIYNDRISGIRNIAGRSFNFIKVPLSRLGGVTKLPLADGTVSIIPTLARTLLDAVYDWSRFGTLPRAYDWIRSKKKDTKTISELIDAALRYGNTGTVRRIGYLLETIDVKSELVKKLKRFLSTKKSTTTLIPWVPNKTNRGKINREWGLIIND